VLRIKKIEELWMYHSGKVFSALMICTLFGGCGTLSRPYLKTPTPTQATQTAALEVVRFSTTDDRSFRPWYAALTTQRRALGLDGITALAISDGGANGAYGAGVLVGWTKSGARPQFDVVTGVSTGALIAPLAFVGPAWDGRLEAAFHDPELGGIARGEISMLVRPSLFDGAALSQLVGRYVDAPLLQAVAAEHDKGRRLLVATTDLDTQESVVWDMGAIAKAARNPADHGVALRLFQRVLIASASIPGLFPPVLIGDGTELSGPPEMYVDGGVTTPFFLISDSMVLWKPEHGMRPKSLYVIINSKVDPTFTRTKDALKPILLRTFDTLGQHQTRTLITVARVFAERNGGTLAYTAIPDSRDADPFNFSRANMASLFALGFDLASGGHAFQSADSMPSLVLGDAR